MDARHVAQTVKTWRDRLAARVVFDLSAAEVAIRQAYRASALPEPSQILWVKGPSEAAQAFAFLENPPRRMWRTAVAVLVLGAAAWVGLALASAGSTLAARPWTEPAIASIALATIALTFAVWPQLPVWPGRPGRGRKGPLILLGAAVFSVLAGSAFAFQRLGGLPVDPIGRGAVLALAASLGTLPGVFLGLRLRRAYAHLRRFLLELSPSASVVRRIERARAGAWAPFQRTAIGPRPDASLLQAYRSAHWEAFARQQGWLLDSGGPTRAPQGTNWVGSGWIASGVFRGLHPETFGGIPAHLDGVEDAPRAAAVAGAGANGSAQHFADLSFHVDRLYLFAAIAVAVQPPTTLALDAEGRPHAEDGPALAWADGTHLYAWHGRVVPGELLDRPVTRSRIDRESDPERGSVLIERYGLGRYFLEAGAAEIQRDDCGRLYRLGQRLSEPILAVQVVNQTPEPDGSFREFWLRVPPTVMTARQAVAWTFGLSTADYDPVAQS
ncbi:MAG: DUF6745 domain-containing protein [Oricola sp.]